MQCGNVMKEIISFWVVQPSEFVFLLLIFWQSLSHYFSSVFFNHCRSHSHQPQLERRRRFYFKSQMNRINPSFFPRQYERIRDVLNMFFIFFFFVHSVSLVDSALKHLSGTGVWWRLKPYRCDTLMVFRPISFSHRHSTISSIRGIIILRLFIKRMQCKQTYQMCGRNMILYNLPSSST